MSEFLRIWITNITVIIILIMFLDTIMPNNSMKRYINVIVGFLVIVVVIRPFALVNEYADSFRSEYIEASGFLEQSGGREDSTEISKYQQLKTIEIFEDNLKSKLEKLIESNIGEEYTDTTVELELDRNIESSGFGNIKAVNVRLSTAQKAVIQVDTIQIDINGKTAKNKTVINKDKAEYNLNDSKISSEIKDVVGRALGISKSIVSVSVQH